MKSLECPVCHEQSAKAWDLFFFAFWISRSCRHCKTRLRINFKTAYMVFWCWVGGLIVCYFVDKAFSVETDFVLGICLLLIMLVPIFVGKRLFSEREVK